jgi:ABC-type oligopeptide transport system substrate-binding subunit
VVRRHARDGGRLRLRLPAPVQSRQTAADYAYLQFPIKNGRKIGAGEITDFNQLGVKAIDDKTLEITLEGPTPFFLGH